jgi:hypothetical protein
MSLNSGEGAKLGMLELLNNIDGDVRRISKSGTDIFSGDDTMVLAMQSQIDALNKQIIANIAEISSLKKQNVARVASPLKPSSASRGNGDRNGSNGNKRKFPNWPKKEEKQTCEIDGTIYK